jgi:hypothetical protein
MLTDSCHDILKENLKSHDDSLLALYTEHVMKWDWDQTASEWEKQDISSSKQNFITFEEEYRGVFIAGAFFTTSPELNETCL